VSDGKGGGLQRSFDHFHELFVLEVNTVIKSEITARPVGSLSHALFDLVRSYRTEAGLATTAERDRTLGDVTAEVANLLDDEAAMAAVAATDCEKRIRSNAQELRRIFKDTRLEGSLDAKAGASLDRVMSREMSAADQSRIRKMRDLGLETVVCQTRVHLDGDVITRVARKLMDEPEKDVLLGIHSDGVQRSVGFWESLAKLGVELLGLAFGGGEKGTG